MSKPAPDIPRYLAYSARGRGDYTDEPWRAMRDEPEPVDDMWLTWFSADALAKADEGR